MRRPGSAGAGTGFFHVRGMLLVAFVGTGLLTGCGPPYVEDYEMAHTAKGREEKRPRVALPDPALLKRPSAPDCGDRTAHRADSAKPDAPPAEPGKQVASAATAIPSEPRSGAESQQNSGSPEAAPAHADMAMRIKLEYERECYRMAEARVRSQLRRLQSALLNSAAFYRRMERDYH